jgi:hypothetical protein
VEAGENIRETSKGDVDEIEIDLKKIILMIKDQENAVLIVPLPEQENANEDVEPHAHIDGGDIAIEFHLL